MDLTNKTLDHSRTPSILLPETNRACPNSNKGKFSLLMTITFVLQTLTMSQAGESPWKLRDQQEALLPDHIKSPLNHDLTGKYFYRPKNPTLNTLVATSISYH